MLEAKDIHKVYYDGAKEITVLKGVNLKIEKSKFAAIVGPSGAGKSTLLHILGGLDCPSQGEVRFFGENIYAQSDSALSRIRNKKIGFVFQFYHLLAEFTVLENVCMPARIDSDGAGADFLAQARVILEKVGLKERLRFFPGQLSGGERQRVAIARALINKPDVLLCDEPTGNLDSRSGGAVVELLHEINRKEHSAVLLVTHNKEIAQSAECVYELRDGILVN